MAKQLITLISTKGKTPEEIHKELLDNLEKYKYAKAEAANSGLFSSY